MPRTINVIKPDSRMVVVVEEVETIPQRQVRKQKEYNVRGLRAERRRLVQQRAESKANFDRTLADYDAKIAEIDNIITQAKGLGLPDEGE